MMSAVMRHSGLLFAGLALLVAPSVGMGDPEYFQRGYYTPASGRVGQPFHADVTFEVDDMPANCIAQWNEMEISGPLPPGLDAAGATSSVIAGTPLTAGTWPVTVTFHALGCTYDPSHVVDRAIAVVFRIAP
jgi:hypothetical protein